MRLALVLPAVCLFACAATAAGQSGSGQVLDVSEEERAHAVARFIFSGGGDLSRITTRHPDGARGMTMFRTDEPPVFSLAIPDRRLDALRLFACGAAAFGPAELIGETVFVGKDDIGVYTKRRFRMLDDWRAESSTDRPLVDIVMPGGELTWKGERIRIDTSDGRFRLNQTYLLIAGNQPQEARATLYEEPRFLEIADGAIHSLPGWKPFPDGTSLEQAKTDVATALSFRGCR